MSEKARTLTPEQERVVKSEKRRLVVSASAGSGKTFVVVEKLIKLICEENVPVSKLLVLTFTKAAANELKSRLYTEILNKPSTPFLIEQIDELLVSDISTIDSFCEKVIKRNVNKLSLPQNFSILDEKGAEGLKNGAFVRAFEYFSSNNPQDFEEVYFAFKRNEDALKECFFSMQAFFDSDRNGDALLEEFKNNIGLFHDKACKVLVESMKESARSAKNILKQALADAQMLGEPLAKGHLQFVEGLESLLSVDFSKGLFDLCREVCEREIPSLSSAKCDLGIKEKFALAKEEVAAIVQNAKLLQNISKDMVDDAEKGGITCKILDFYCQYAKEYRLLKEKRSALDFSDLENYARRLLEDEEIKKSLQQRYDYIIIDEYQDTNRLQEALLKPIAEGGYFIAVGDVKQGIYGFRNASKEIMSQDIEEFPKSSDGEALFLRGNFRTDSKILNFVNDVFAKLMTKESVGIDYKQTSMLEGKNEFLPNSLPAVRIDVVLPSDEENEGKDEGDVWADIYSVKEDLLSQNFKFKEEVKVIASRIEEVLRSQIYSPKTKQFRKAEQCDIALLFRNRGQLMQECVAFLQEKGLAVNADIKENLLEDGQISTIVSLIKLSINENDDISLASVMTSFFGGFSFEELADLRRENPEGKFYEVLISSENEKLKIFIEMLGQFKFNIQCFGLVKALEILFAKTGYFNYIQSLDDANLKRLRINKLFSLIKTGNLDYCPQEVVSQLESSSKEGGFSADGGNAVTVTTIHATKGLEYPVVILCGCGENLNKVYNKNYIITKEFGLANYLYSFEDNLRLPSPAFLAGKMVKKKLEFVDEIMLFYVAMTRAQNHLYIIGSAKQKDFSFSKIDKQNTYLKLIFFALGENFLSQLFEQEMIRAGSVEYSLLDKVEEKPMADEMKISHLEFNDAIDEYCEFSYPNKKYCKLSYKNSVTGATKISLVEEVLPEGEVLYKDEFIDEEVKAKREKAIEVGNSYHEALKYINFDLAKSLEGVKEELEKIKPFVRAEYLQNIDAKLLYENLSLIKQVVGVDSVFKEKEFIMQCTPSEIGLANEDCEENELIIQGIVDLFSVGEKVVLVDYKYTSIKDEEILIEKYRGQLGLYQKALEKALGRKVDEIYLLSLKDAKLIKLLN